jgi:hypothetical protein
VASWSGRSERTPLRSAVRRTGVALRRIGSVVAITASIAVRRRTVTDLSDLTPT